MLTGGLALATLIAGCAAGDARTGFTVEVRDSAGVQIVENRGAEVPDSMVLRDATEELRIGTLEGPPELQLHQVTGLAVDSRGNILVGDNGSGTVKVFDADGRFLRALGGRGSGPGEFPQGVGWIWLENDTVAVYAGERIVGFDAAGEAVATEATRSPTGSAFNVRAGLPGRWVGVLNGTDNHPRFTGVPHVESPLVRVDLAHTERIDTLLTVPVRPIHPVRGGSDIDWPVFAVTPAWGVAADGALVVHGGLPYEYRVYDAGGALRRIVRRDWEPKLVTGAEADERYRGLVRARWDTVPGTSVEQMLARTDRRLALPHPDSLPPLGMMLLGADGGVWLLRNDLLAEDPVRAEWELFNTPVRMGMADRPVRWDVFDAEGRFLAAVELPARFRPAAVDGDRVTGVQLDDMDVEYVVRYRVEGLDAYRTLGTG